MLVQKLVIQIKFWSKKYFGKKKLVKIKCLVLKKFGKKSLSCLWSKKFWYKTDNGPKKFWPKKKLLSEKKIVVQKKFWFNNYLLPIADRLQRQCLCQKLGKKGLSNNDLWLSKLQRQRSCQKLGVERFEVFFIFEVS